MKHIREIILEDIVEEEIREKNTRTDNEENSDFQFDNVIPLFA